MLGRHLGAQETQVVGLVKDFERQLDALWHRRTADLRYLLHRRPGARKVHSKRHRDRGLKRVQSVAEEFFRRTRARGELRRITRGTRQRRIGGRGLTDRFRRIVEWAQKHLRGPILYSFWRRRKCLYVGKEKSWRRLRAYRKSAYLREATKLKVRAITRKRDLPKAECLEIHLWQPRDNVVKAAKKRYARACPICADLRVLRSELRSLFRLRA